jgi:hypothetical protein
VHGVRCLIPPSEVVLECCASRVPFWLVWHRERSRILVYDFVLLVDDDIENGSITIAVLRPILVVGHMRELVFGDNRFWSESKTADRILANLRWDPCNKILYVLQRPATGLE